jgi:hypothetical protein
MKRHKSPLKGLLIRTAVVRASDLGFIYACDPKKEEKEIPHTIVFTWDTGVLNRADYPEYNAHTACIIQHPEIGLLDASEAGYYTVQTRTTVTSEDIFDVSGPPPAKPRRRGIRSVSEICGTAYAVGIRGMVYRLDDLSKWTRLDDGLPDSFDVQAIHGFDDADLYAVGRRGELWQYNGKKWLRRDLETNGNLTSVKCAADGTVYIGGYGGMLIRGRGDTWEVIDHDDTEEDVWDVEWFANTLYVSTLDGLFRLKGNHLQTVDYGADVPETTYQLSVAGGVMWSNGERDVMSFDGKLWTRIV